MGDASRDDLFDVGVEDSWSYTNADTGIYFVLYLPILSVPSNMYTWKAKCPIFKVIVAGFRGKVA